MIDFALEDAWRELRNQDLADAANAMLATYGASPLPVADVVAMVGEGARTLVARALEILDKDDEAWRERRALDRTRSVP